MCRWSELIASNQALSFYLARDDTEAGATAMTRVAVLPLGRLLRHKHGVRLAQRRELVAWQHDTKQTRHKHAHD